MWHPAEFNIVSHSGIPSFSEWKIEKIPPLKFDDKERFRDHYDRFLFLMIKLYL